MCGAVTESIMFILVLFLVAGGGIIVIDALVVRRIRRIHAEQVSGTPHSSEDRSIGE